MDYRYGSHLTNPCVGYHFFVIRFSDAIFWVEPSSHSLAELEEGQGNSPFLGKWLVLQINLELPLEVIEDSVLPAIRSRRAFASKTGVIKLLPKRSRAPSLLVEYLRVLDAQAAGVSIPQMGEILHPSDQNTSAERTRDKRLRAALKVATRFRDEEFRVLPLLRSRFSKPRKEK